jgi:hypothetical protein
MSTIRLISAVCDALPPLWPGSITTTRAPLGVDAGAADCGGGEVARDVDGGDVAAVVALLAAVRGVVAAVVVGAAVVEGCVLAARVADGRAAWATWSA